MELLKLKHQREKLKICKNNQRTSYTILFPYFSNLDTIRLYLNNRLKTNTVQHKYVNLLDRSEHFLYNFVYQKLDIDQTVQILA